MLNNRRQKALYKGFSRAFMLGIMLMLVVFLTSFVSAYEFDNVVSNYDATTKTATITNAYDLPLIGSTIADVQLKSEQNVQVGLGYQKVFQYDIDSKQDYANFIKETEIYNLKADAGTLSNKKVDLKYLTYEDYDVPDYKKVCSLNKNGTNECINEVSGTHKEQREVWKDLTSMDVKAGEKITISGWANVKQGDYYEWIPSFAGVRVQEWATWTGNISVGMVTAFDFIYQNEGGKIAIDSLILGNGTITGTPANITTKLDYGYNFTGAGKYAISPKRPASNNFTFVFGFKAPPVNNQEIVSGSIGAIVVKGNGTICEELSDDWSDTCGNTSVSFTDWNLLIWEYENQTSWSYIYVNNVLALKTNTRIMTANTSASWNLPRSDTNVKDIAMDFVYVWGRSLSESEITLLYNSGKWCAYGNESCYSPPDNPPTITLNSPANAFTSTAQLMTLNGTGTDDIKLQNMTLYLNNTINQTNTSVFNNTLTTFSLTLPDGFYSWHIGVCDNATAPQCVNATARNLTINSVPIINITSPPATQNNSNYTTKYVYINATNSLAIDDWKLNINGTNYTITINSSFGFLEGLHHLNLYGRNAISGKYGLNDTMYLTINTVPSIYVISPPANNSNYTESSVYINASNSLAIDEWKLNYIGTNNTITINSTFVFVDGTYQLLLYGRNAISGKYGLNNSLYISVDTIHPTISAGLNATTIYNVGDAILLNTTITDTNLNKCWYNYNGINTTITGCLTATLNQTTITTVAGRTNIIVYANDTLGNNATPVSLSFAYDNVPPTLVVTGGNGTIGYQPFTTNHTLNYTITDTNLNVCWINYNATNRTMPCTTGAINTTNFTLQNGIYNATLWANDTLGNYQSLFTEWNYNILFLNSTYDATRYETQPQLFINNLVYNTSASLQVKLNYDGTNYSTTNTGSGANGIFSTPSFETPLVYSATNKTFYWIFIYNSTTITNSASLNQTVYPIIFVLCNGTYSNKTLNFTFIDENTGITIPATTGITFKSSYKYWFGSGLTQKTYAYQLINTTTTNNFSFCIDPADYTFYADIDLQYSAEGYAERTRYFRNASLTNSTQNISLYLLPLVDTTKFTIRVKTGTTLFTGATTTVEKYFVGEGIYKLVMTGFTDDKGTFVSNLELDQNYRFNISKDGINYNPIIKQASCSVAPCEIELNTGDLAVSSFEDYYDYFAQNVDFNLTNNKTLQIVNLSFVDKLGTANYWRLHVYKINLSSDTPTTICDTNVYSISGNVQCNYTGYSGEIIAKAYISRSPEKLVDFITFVNENINQILGGSAILASIIIFCVILFAGIRNPVNIFVLIPFALIILKFIAFLPLSWTWIVSITVFDIWIIMRLNS